MLCCVAHSESLGCSQSSGFADVSIAERVHLTELEIPVKSLLCKRDVDSLKYACDVAKCSGASQAMHAQISAQESAANRSGETSAKRQAQLRAGVEVPQKLPLTLEQLCQRSNPISAEAKQLFSEWNQQHGVGKKEAKLDDVLDSMQAVQQTAPGNHLHLYGNCCVRCCTNLFSAPSLAHSVAITVIICAQLRC
jgi:hypothetical protein